ncbi:hypothetical protein Tco_1411179 [Tanacetum coccineum]
MIDCEVKGVTTRGGKTTTQDVQDNNTNVQREEALVVDLDKMPSSEVQTPPVPFPKRVRKEKEEAQQKRFLENLKQLYINLSFIEALAQMPKYAKFLKGLLRNKSKLEEPCMKPELEKISEEEKSSLLKVLEKLKEAEDLVADYLSRFESTHMEVLTKKESTDEFPDEHLMLLKFKFKDDEPWCYFIIRLKMYPGKLKSKWSSPNIVKTVYPHGAIEITDKDGVSFKVNGQRLKRYYGGNIDEEDDEVIEFENYVT